MVTTTFGEISWNDNIGNDRSKNSKDVFLRLDQGPNDVRLLTLPQVYTAHKYKVDPENPKDYGTKVSCSMVHGTCPLCDAGDKPEQRFLLGVIDRKTKSYRILDCKMSIVRQIRDLYNNPKWGDPKNYDLTITADKNKPIAQYYSVQPNPKEALTAEDHKLLDEVDMDDLKRRVTPLTPDQVLKRVEAIHEKAKNQQGSKTQQNNKTMAPSAPQMSAASKKVAPKKAAPPPVAEEGDDEFPAFDSND